MITHFGGYWDEWFSGLKVDINGNDRLIRVHPGHTLLDIRHDVYSSLMEWMQFRDNSKYPVGMRYSGLDPIPGGITGAVFFMTNGWRLIIDPNIHQITGVLYSDDFPSGYYNEDMEPVIPITVSSVVNQTTTTQNVITGDLSSVPAAVWGHASRGLTEFADQSIDIALAVRNALATELARIDASISSRHEAGVMIPANVKKMNDANVIGTGIESDKWRGA